MLNAYYYVLLLVCVWFASSLRTSCQAEQNANGENLVKVVSNNEEGRRGGKEEGEIHTPVLEKPSIASEGLMIPKMRRNIVLHIRTRSVVHTPLINARKVPSTITMVIHPRQSNLSLHTKPPRSDSRITKIAVVMSNPLLS